MMMMMMICFKNRSTIFSPLSIRRRHLCATLALIYFMINIKDQHIFFFVFWRQNRKIEKIVFPWRDKESVLPWRSSGTVCSL